jgi:hypothetical protein
MNYLPKKEASLIGEANKGNNRKFQHFNIGTLGCWGEAENKYTLLIPTFVQCFLIP